ncbi:hypothetical protein KI387_027710, partial [Taxus chinensis]
MLLKSFVYLTFWVSHLQCDVDCFEGFFKIRFLTLDDDKATRLTMVMIKTSINTHRYHSYKALCTIVNPVGKGNGNGNGKASATPCAACKILRRRCVEKFLLAPYFPPNNLHKFATAHH